MKKQTRTKTAPVTVYVVTADCCGEYEETLGSREEADAWIAKKRAGLSEGALRNSSNNYTVQPVTVRVPVAGQPG